MFGYMYMYMFEFWGFNWVIGAAADKSIYIYSFPPATPLYYSQKVVSKFWGKKIKTPSYSKKRILNF